MVRKVAALIGAVAIGMVAAGVFVVGALAGHVAVDKTPPHPGRPGVVVVKTPPGPRR